MSHRLSIAVTVAVAIATALAASATVASAQPVDEARALYDRGLQHYNLGEYTAAINAWKEAYRISHAPLLLFNIGQAHRLSGDCANARIFYATYRREEASPPNESELAAAEALCPESTKPPEPPIVENKHTAKAVLPPTTKPITSTPPPPRTTTTHAGRTRRIAGLALTGTGVAAALAGGYFLRSAASASSDVEAADGEWTPELADLEARGRRDQTIGLGTAGAGVAFVSAGVVLYVLGRRADSVELAPTSGGASVAIRARF